MRLAHQALPGEQGLLVLPSLQERSPRGDLPQEPGRPGRSPLYSLGTRIQTFLPVSFDFQMYQFKKTSEPYLGPTQLEKGRSSEEGPLLTKAGETGRRKPPGLVVSARHSTNTPASGLRGQGQAVLPRSAMGQGGLWTPRGPGLTPPKPACHGQVQQGYARYAPRSGKPEHPQTPQYAAWGHAPPPPTTGHFPKSVSMLSFSRGHLLPRKVRFMGQ